MASRGYFLYHTSEAAVGGASLDSVRRLASIRAAAERGRGIAASADAASPGLASSAFGPPADFGKKASGASERMVGYGLLENEESAGMTALLGGGEGRSDEREFAAKFEKALREMVNPLIFLKTAKSRVFRAQGYQGLSKTPDFAGEAISFRFRFVWSVFRLARNFVATALPVCPTALKPGTIESMGRPQARKNLEKPLTSTNDLFRFATH
jgi:hypothetical protein